MFPSIIRQENRPPPGFTGESSEYTFLGDPYQGEWINALPHGKGIWEYQDGNRYEGDFRAGEFEGEGKLTLADGKEYIGMFTKGGKIRDNKEKEN